MAHQKIKELYYNYNLVANGTPIWYNVHIIHIDVINHVWFFDKFTLIACGNYITTNVWHQHIQSCYVYAFQLPIKYDTCN
jgi:hypothetical protein